MSKVEILVDGKQAFIGNLSKEDIKVVKMLAMLAEEED